MAKKYYKNKATGNYGVLEGSGLSAFATRANQSSVNDYLNLRILIGIGGMIELSSRTEQVHSNDLIEVTEDEVVRTLLNI
ncbi:hypothetical protein GTQ43_38785 [Nostoc sp. KVJ3]|uniref:hypothetical protein n=1 Tax=Nostoc sp. KVJ3 TaxID=457945 RepID=UPI0022385261|nr:hypothetical protein [Nostoc sp. KVJ3]MCW5319314.1 hypothetical protein [Nostoc sp. KVJ3]